MGSKSVKIHIDYIRRIWHIGTYLSADAGLVAAQRGAAGWLSARHSGRGRGSRPRAKAGMHCGSFPQHAGKRGFAPYIRGGAACRARAIAVSKKHPKGASAGSRGSFGGQFCLFRENSPQFTAKRLTTPIPHDRISSEVSYYQDMASVSKNI